MSDTVRTLNKLLKEKGVSDNTEVTHYRGKYHLLHILSNGVPIQTAVSKNVQDIRNEIEVRY